MSWFTGPPGSGWVARALTSRFVVVVFAPWEGYLAVAVFWRGKLLLWIDRAAGQA